METWKNLSIISGGCQRGDGCIENQNMLGEVYLQFVSVYLNEDALKILVVR